MVVTFGLHFASRYPGSCDLKATLREQISGAVGQISLSRPVIPVMRADIRGGWADRDAMSCAARLYCEFDGFLCLEWVFWLYGVSRGSDTHIEKASWV